MPNEIKTTDLGIRRYGEILEFQTSLFTERVDLKKKGEDSGADRILIVEHFPVFTLGKHADSHNLLMSKDVYASMGYDVYEINRGGDVTYHCPGQIVCYPIIDLQRRNLGVKKYVDILEEAVIRTIGDFGIRGERVEGATGVWIAKGTPEERKICAIGIKCSRFISMHGLALNVNADLTGFNLINPCGFTDKGVTSIEKELGEKVDIALVKGKLVRYLKELLSQTWLHRI